MGAGTDSEASMSEPSVKSKGADEREEQNDRGVDFMEQAEKIRQDQKLFWKVPGRLPPVGQMKHERAALLSQLKKKTTPQLQEILERQEKLLANRYLVTKLPDRGEKARQTVEEVKNLLLERSQKGQEEASQLAMELSKLHLPDTDAMEWTRGRAFGGNFTKNEVDPNDALLRTLTEKEVPSQKVAQDEIDLFALQMAQAVDRIPAKNRFQPYAATEYEKSGKSGTLSPSTSTGSPKPKSSSIKQAADVKKECQGAAGGARTARNVPSTPAIPLPLVYTCKTKLLTLKESLELQQEHARHSRTLMLKQAAAKLQSVNRLGSNSLDEKVATDQIKDVAKPGEWRNNPQVLDSDDDSDEEHGDETGGDDGDEQQDDSDDDEKLLAQQDLPHVHQEENGED